MTMTLELFRNAVSARRHGRKHGARRYEEALVAFAVEHARMAAGNGRSAHATAKELGISMMTLQSWQQRGVAGDVHTGRILPVSVTAADVATSTSASAGTLRLTTRDGHVVSGLDVTQLAALLRVLS